jgi:uncharacterized protein
MRHTVFAATALALFLGSLLSSSSTNAAEEQKSLGSGSGQSPGTRTIAVVGDSLGDGLWGGLWVLLRQRHDIKVVRGAKNSVGFTHTNLIAQVDQAFKPGKADALIVMVGGNDDRQTFFVDDKPAALFGSEQWSKLYLESLNRYMDYISSKDVPIVWVLLPIMRTPEATNAAKLVNGLIEDAAKSHPRIALVSTWDMTVDAKGAYAPYFKDLQGTMRLMRTSDGMHFTDQGAEVLADRVWKRLIEVAPVFRPATASAAGKP